jgi:hypothetical protein
VIVAIIIAAWLYSLAIAVLQPVALKGWIVGALIAVLKLGTATTSALLAISVSFASMGEYQQKRRPNRVWIASLWSAMFWVAFCLIKGGARR